MNFKTFRPLTYLSIIIVALGLIFLANGLVLAWTPPSQTPPSGNVSAPINVGNSSQNKEGLNSAIGAGVSGGAYYWITPNGFRLAAGTYWIYKNGDSIAFKNTAGITNFIVGQDGNVGIRTTSPGADLTVEDTAAAVIQARSTQAGSSAIIQALANGAASYSRLSLKNDTRQEWLIQNQGSDSDKLYFYDQTGAKLVMALDKSGNVGINTNSPTTKLDINGQIRIRGGSPTDGYVLTSDASGLATWKASAGTADNDWIISGNNMYSGVSGNVGIGITNPIQKLDINGWIKAKGLVDGDNQSYDVDPAATSDLKCIKLGDTATAVEKCSWPGSQVIVQDSGYQPMDTVVVYCPAGYMRTGCSGAFLVEGCYDDARSASAYRTNNIDPEGCETFASKSRDTCSLKTRVWAYCLKQ